MLSLMKLKGFFLRWPLIGRSGFCFVDFRDDEAIRCAAKTTSHITHGVTSWRTRATLASSLTSSMRDRAMHHDTLCLSMVERFTLATVINWWISWIIKDELINYKHFSLFSFCSTAWKILNQPWKRKQLDKSTAEPKVVHKCYLLNVDD